MSAIIVEKLARQQNITKKAARRCVAAYFEAIGEMLDSVEKVQIPRLGMIRAIKHGAKYAHNPATGKKVFVPPKYSISFKACKSIEEGLNG